MTAHPKWRIGVTHSTHHMIEVECASAQEACELAINCVRQDLEYYKTGFCCVVTSVMINDRETRDFASYVPEFIERQTDAK